MEALNLHNDIVVLCRQGNRQAQFELYRLYSKAMYNICLRITGKQEDAEDVLQQAFVDVFTKLDSFRFESSIGAWIKRIVVNRCINHLKKRQLQFEELDDRFNNQIQDRPDDNEIDNYMVENIKKAMFQLPEGYRVVFSLYLLEGYDHEEIGQVLGISEQTSKSQFSRAKAKLREILKNDIKN